MPVAQGVAFTSHSADLPRSITALSRPRQLLENLARSRGRHGRSAGAEAVEATLIRILNASGDAELNRIRDAARDLAKPLGLERELTKLDGLIGALLATQSQGNLKTREGKLVAKGTPIDAERMERFEILASALRSEPLPRRLPVATAEPARSNPAIACCPPPAWSADAGSGSVYWGTPSP